MWAMGNYFAGLAEHPFYELAANFWRYRAYQKGSSAAKDWFQRWAKEHGKQGMSSLMSETMSGTFQGKVLRAMGFLFFEPDREYALVGQMRMEWWRSLPGAAQKDLTRMALAWKNAMTGGI